MAKTMKNIFTAENLFDFCFATYCGDAGSRETEYQLDFEDFLDEDVVDLYDTLVPADQKLFDQAIRRVLKKYGSDFKKLPTDIDSDIKLAAFLEQKTQLTQKVVSMMPEFFTEIKK